MISETIKLDQIITNSMLIAESKCCKRKVITLWTTEMYQANLAIQYLNIQHKKKNSHISIDHRLSYLKSKMTNKTFQLMQSYEGTSRQKL
jgi:hypothetical protein